MLSRLKLKHLRYTAFILPITTGLLCLVLLLNMTAPNPTGRRYSSEMPVISGASNAEIGRSGERVLGQDLRTPNNNDPDQRQCLCGNTSSPPGSCNVCVVQVPTITTYRTPDFVTHTFIAESKNRRSMLASDEDYADLVAQIGDYRDAALKLNIPLWLYVRTNTSIAPIFAEMTRETGGGLVHYFTVPDYRDPVDTIAWVGLAVSVGILLLLVVLTVLRRPRSTAVPVTPRTPTQRSMDKAIDKTMGKVIDKTTGKAIDKTTGKAIDKTIDKAEDSTKATEEMMRRLEDKARNEIDADDDEPTSGM